MNDYARVDFPRARTDDPDSPGSEAQTWWPLTLVGGRRGASLACPEGHVGGLIDHEIANDGTVSPSVVCPYDDCGFHEWVRLLDWATDSSGPGGDE